MKRIPELVMMVGLPRSGKTTKALTMGVPIVSPDAIRLALHGQRFVPATETMVWTLAKYMVSALFFAGHSKVVLDACNTTRMRRAEWKSNQYRRSFCIVLATPSLCINRARNAGDEEIIPVIERMHARFEFPGPEEEDEEGKLAL